MGSSPFPEWISWNGTCLFSHWFQGLPSSTCWPPNLQTQHGYVWKKEVLINGKNGPGSYGKKMTKICQHVWTYLKCTCCLLDTAIFYAGPIHIRTQECPITCRGWADQKIMGMQLIDWLVSCDLSDIIHCAASHHICMNTDFPLLVPLCMDGQYISTSCWKTLFL